MKKILTRDDILGATDLKQQRVEVPEWGGAVIVQELTGAARDEYESSIVTLKGTKAEINSKNLRAKLVALSLVDEKGKQLFTAKDVEKLGQKSAGALDRVVDVAKHVSRIGDEELESLGEGSATIRPVASASS